MVSFETVMSGLCDEFPVFRKRRFITACSLGILFFIIGLPQVTQVLKQKNQQHKLKFYCPPTSALPNCFFFPLFSGLYK